MSPFTAIKCSKTLATHVAVGMCAASFWRGVWYLLDDNLFPDNATHSAGASLGLGVAGMAASQGLGARAERMATRPGVRPIPLTLARFGALYCVALSCVLVWRGTWLGWDCLYENVLHMNNRPQEKATDPGHATHSGLLSKGVALMLLVGTGLFASVLAPPAAVSVIRDFTVVKSGQRTALALSSYQEPAQTIVNQMFQSSTTAGVSRAIPTAVASARLRAGPPSALPK